MPSLSLRTCTVDLDRRVVSRGGQEQSLTAREAELLTCFAGNPGRILDRAWLLRAVWGYRGGAETRVVDMTVRRLRARIEGDPAEPDHIRTARGGGYRFEPLAIPEPDEAEEGYAQRLATWSDGVPGADETVREALRLFSPEALLARIQAAPFTVFDAAGVDRLLAALRDDDRAAVAQLAAFALSFDVEAAESVVIGVAGPVWRWVQRLVAAGVVRPAPDRRFALLPLVRARTTGTDVAAELRHGTHHARLRGAAARAAVDEVLDATDRAVARGDALLASEACRALESMGQLPDHADSARRRIQARRERIRGALGLAGAFAEAAVQAAGADALTRARALRSAAWVHNLRGDVAGAITLLDEAETLAASDRLLRAEIRADLAVNLKEKGDLARASHLIAAAEVDAAAAGDPPRVRLDVLMSRGIVQLAGLTASPADPACRDTFAACAELARTLGEGVTEAWALNNRGEALRIGGDLPGAEAAYAESAQRFREADAADVFVPELNLGICRLARGDAAGAVAVFDPWPARFEAAGRRGRVAVVACLLAACHAQLDDCAAFDTWLDVAATAIRETGYRDADMMWALGLVDRAEPAWAQRVAAARALRVGG